MKHKINLFHQKEQAPIDKITYFALHYLRYILVITQLVAIGVFFYRFKVDQEIVDLKDTLEQKKAIVQNTTSLLDTVKEMDTKLNNVQKLLDKQNMLQAKYTYIIQKLPLDVTLLTLEVNSDQVLVNGKTPNIEAVRTLYEEIKAENKFANVSLSNINKEEDGYKFNLVLKEYQSTDGS